MGLCCCRNSRSSSPCASCWLKFIGWTQIVVYPAVVVVSLISMVTARIFEMREWKVADTPFSHSTLHILLTLSYWLPWFVPTIPAFLIHVTHLGFIKVEKEIGRSWVIIEGSRIDLGQSFTRLLTTLAILTVGVDLAWLLLTGIKQKNIGKLKAWTIFVGMLMSLNVIEGVTDLLGLLDGIEVPLLLHASISFCLQGTILLATCRLTATILRDGQEEAEELHRIQIHVEDYG